uniref:Dihydrolipoamide acetyltransferase component of pyruvate dehydrogenase complex n=1 Tax=Candidatus Kentrum sp. TUN TaxID=2126343 RepID=A0A450ZEC7_9GAMM|nr:MAG: pyruvate dehydrogenase E2 component (dihydrolipoamide acetyltransferase) [Candidatus Kentron sp. TUN]VFK58843.1 MAG: pyruvate dehydrogenase E2 component (dihydrolipoamide acetyltransferase) [Candidatus Kentron sp. TUN]VFK67533.1 MAG: pyruvate dehydrogenase E2 component (dihydrolipoamide acetyltransferase) [Candidatus Kentron sp. TUN]
MNTVTEVKIPDIGDFRDVEIIEVLITPGIRIESGDPLITLESDKATLEIPSSRAGIVKEVTIAVGDKVSEGDLILTMVPEERQEVSVSKADSPMADFSARETPSEIVSSSPPPASPSVRRLARELGIDIGSVEGTGHKGRILREDVERSAGDSPSEIISPGGTSPAKAPAVDFSEFGTTEISPLSRIQKLSGSYLSRTWRDIPHVTHHDLADITDLEGFRESLRENAETRGTRITLLGFLMKASVAALEAFPTFNASLASDGENLIIKHYYHIGVAVDTPEGLVVPVIRDVDKKGIFELSEELTAIGNKAREKRLAPKDLQGGCFTISSLGAMGGTGFTPILNAPEVAILGVARSSMQPVYIDGEFQPRCMLPLSLSYDHRVIDGVDGARFMNSICSSLADIRRLLL